MKKRLVAVLIVVVVMVAGCGNSNSVEESAGADSQMTENETDELSTIEGTVLEINETNILINESGYENGECYLIISDDTVIYVDGEKSDISMIEVGQSIKVMYTGGIEEIYPSMINEVIEIIAEHPSGTERNLVAGENTITIDGVTMEVTEYSDTSVTVRITNDTDMNIRCGGEDFCLKILDGETGEWRDLDTVIDDYAFFEEAYMIQKDSPYEMVIDFEWLYGKLEPGRYQIVKTVTDFRGTGDYTNYVYAAEFDISMEEAEHSIAEASVMSQPDISVASFWDREEAVKLSAEDAAVIAGLVESGSWMKATGDCLDDCIIFMGGEEIQYHSNCGTFNDTVNEKSLHLTEEQQAEVNAILEKYISLEQGLSTSPDMEEKPSQSAESSGIPKDGTIQDGKIYFEGFGWVDYEGGGTEGTYAEDIYENGNTIGTMD